jgi:RNA polymerase sigma-70 factor (ECF subfamily)
MKRYDYLKYTEIAEILNISINTVKTQMKRALKSLLKNLAYLMPCLF